MSCPLCQSETIFPFSTDKVRSYLQCGACSLVFVSREELISASREKERYEAHTNSETDPDYEKYLRRVSEAINKVVTAPSKGLDFGCGKTRLLENLLGRCGHEVNSFDLFFYPDQNVFTQKYNFIVMSEVIEHLRDPYLVLQHLASLLKKGGYLFIKTKFLPTSEEEFDSWFYKRDLTHIQFFNEKSLRKASALMGLGSFCQIGKDLYALGMMEEK